MTMTSSQEWLMLSMCSGQLKQNGNVMWSNVLVQAPAVYSLVERRVLYFITLEVKKRYTEKNLGVPQSWNDLYFSLTDEDLAVIGGKTHVLQTYEALADIGEKFFPIEFKNDKGEWIRGRVHWVDTFFYNETTKQYDVRVSPEVMPYLINLSKSFTLFNVYEAMQLSSKYSQKFYELCCHLMTCEQSDNQGNTLSKGVARIEMEHLRFLLNLNAITDVRTGKLLQKNKYSTFKDFKRRVLDTAQTELFRLYQEGGSSVWFDYCIADTEGKKITSIYLMVYSKENPKLGPNRPWKAGDAPLVPWAERTKQTTPRQASDMTKYYEHLEVEQLEMLVNAILSRYLKPEEVAHYMRQLRASQYHNFDTYMQVLQTVQEKERQTKFKTSTKAYQRKNIIEFVLQENLQEFGVRLSPPTKAASVSR